MWGVILLVLPRLFSLTPAFAEQGFDPKYERDYNIFNPINRYQPDTPLNPINAYDPKNPLNPINHYDPGSPANPMNQYNPSNPYKSPQPISSQQPAEPHERIQPFGAISAVEPFTINRSTWSSFKKFSTKQQHRELFLTKNCE